MVCTSCSAENDEDADSCFRCGKSLYALVEGAVLAGRYEILKTVGRGGMGIVYKAHDRELDEAVAVKLLRAEALRSTDALRRLKGEVRLARRIRHRNVSVIHELGQEGHLRFVIMEFVDGVDLKHVLRSRGRLPPDEALPLLIQAAAGLEAIHEAAIVHRDLKTPNIMLDRRGLVRLMDFGIAKVFDVESEAGGTATGNVVGTPEYMSPEQVRGERLDARSDIYAFGIVAYELLTGAVPFKGDTPLATLFKQVQEPPPLEGERARHLPAALIPVLRRMLAKDRGDRMATARDAIVALEAVRSAPPGPAPGPRSHPPILLGTEAPDEHPEAAAPTPMPTNVPLETGSLLVPTQSVVTPMPTLGSLAPAAGLPAAEASPAATPRGHVSRRWLGPGVLVAAVTAGGVGFWQMRGNPATKAGDVPVRASLPPPEVAPRPHVDAPVTTGAPKDPAVIPRAARGRGMGDAAATGQAGTPSAGAGSTALRPKRGDAAPPATVAIRPPTPTPVTSGAQTVVQAPAIADAGPDTKSAAPPSEATGLLRVVVRPWAEVTVDGKAMGATPLVLTLRAGPHSVQLLHPEYRPYVRRLTIPRAETVKLEIDLSLDGIRK